MVVSYENEVKNDLKSQVSILTASPIFGDQEEKLKTHKQQKLDELRLLEEKMNSVREEIETINSKMKEIHENAEKAQNAAVLLKRSIEDLPQKDVFNEEKLEVMKSRVKLTLKKFAKRQHVKRGELKTIYKCKSMIGSEGSGEGQLRVPYSSAIDETGEIYVADTSTYSRPSLNRTCIPSWSPIPFCSSSSSLLCKHLIQNSYLNAFYFSEMTTPSPRQFLIL